MSQASFQTSPPRVTHATRAGVRRGDPCRAPEGRTAPGRMLERQAGFEPATPTLATWCSTPELLPHLSSASARIEGLVKTRPPPRFALPRVAHDIAGMADFPEGGDLPCRWGLAVFRVPRSEGQPVMAGLRKAGWLAGRPPLGAGGIHQPERASLTMPEASLPSYCPAFSAFRRAMIWPMLAPSAAAFRAKMAISSALICTGR